MICTFTKVDDEFGKVGPKSKITMRCCYFNNCFWVKGKDGKIIIRVILRDD